MGKYTIFCLFENPRRGMQARNFTTNLPKTLDLKSSSEQIFSRKLLLGAPARLIRIMLCMQRRNKDPCKASSGHRNPINRTYNRKIKIFSTAMRSSPRKTRRNAFLCAGFKVASPQTSFGVRLSRIHFF